MVVSRGKVSVNAQNCAIIAFVLYLSYEPIYVVLDIVFPSVLAMIFAFIIIYLPLLLSIYLSKKIPWDFLMFFLIIVLIFAISYMFHPEYHDWYFEGSYRLTRRIFRPDRYLYAYLFVRTINKPENVLKSLKFASLILLFYYSYRLLHAMSVGYWITNSTGTDIQASYDLNYGYGHLLVFSTFLVTAYREKKKRYYLLALISAMEVFLGGSRGPIIFMVVLFVILFVYKIQKSGFDKKIFLIGLSLVFIGIFAYIGFEGICSIAGNILAQFGFGDSRTVQNLINGTISDDNGREELYLIAINMIKQNGLIGLGYGAYGDRYVIRQAYIWVGYCHNIILELMIDYGFIAGLILTITIVANVLKMLFTNIEQDWKYLFLIFFIPSCKLLLSGSYWYSESFFAAIAVCVSYKLYKKHREIRLKLPRMF